MATGDARLGAGGGGRDTPLMSNLLSVMDMEDAERQMQFQPSLSHIQSLQVC